MYTLIYLYRVKLESIETFIDMNHQAGEIYMSHGSLEEKTYQAEDLSGHHNYKGLIEVIQKEDDEVIFLVQSVFRNKSHYNDVMDQVSIRSDIRVIRSELGHTTDLSNVITATFATDGK
ncbi:DUF1428 family protein [Lentibacillus amyloliquefaciens]|uniref:Uncharacterized protein n=1 Tax=Lentibacillus amyloliquefaciens TaxID=1472767 RepID=A0A0U4F5W6_9BACI|nr:DUF1428 family protein [Lentibacillus amyloliquefaciens]ALX48982.1 hypothetical protein AOX59_10460 [Lentibacillus amyloliquefaciens]